MATWGLGGATCESCVKIVGLIPLEPILPELGKCLHRQWKSYGGFTFAFKDYTEVNLTTWIDTPQFVAIITNLSDVMPYYDRLARLPKYIFVTSDDEFMQMDWTELWYNEIKGETHLLVVPNEEHAMVTGLPEVISAASCFL